MSNSLTSSGVATPLSSTSTLSVPSSPKLGNAQLLFQAEEVFNNPRIPASNLIELISSRPTVSSAVYIYDLAEQAGFGALTKLWSKTQAGKKGVQTVAPVIDLQTRAGAGLSLIGRLSEQGTSTSVVRTTGPSAVLTAYTTPTGLSHMAHALSFLPKATPSSRLIVQVPVVEPVDSADDEGNVFALAPSLAGLNGSGVLSVLPEDVVVLLSGTPQEAVDFAALAYTFVNKHVVHLFDHHSGTRETGHGISPVSIDTKSNDDEEVNLTVTQKVAAAGYSPFEYAGDSNAETVVVVLNGQLGLSAKATTARLSSSGLGVVLVKVLRPWDEAAFARALPKSAKKVHVLDEVPNGSTQGALYVDVFGSLLGSPSDVQVKSHRIVPSQTLQYSSHPSFFISFLTALASPGIAPPSTLSSSFSPTKKLAFFSTPNSPLASVPHVIESTFVGNDAISVRLLTDYDVFSKQGGLSASRLLLSQKLNNDDSEKHVPIPALAALDEAGFEFISILDPALIKTHDLFAYAAEGAAVLIATTWSAAEFASTVPASALALIKRKQLRIYLTDAKGLVSKLPNVVASANDAVQNYVIYLSFLRLYLGSVAAPDLVRKISRAALNDEIGGVGLEKINSLAWEGLVQVDVDGIEILEENSSILKNFEFNAIVPETELEDNESSSASVGSWHVAAKHLLFPSAFGLSSPTQDDTEEFPRNPALHPEIPEKTYLVTCSVNRRLTPLEYNRNLFHIEFDTRGTGLKYAVGEALAVHGWNDEKEVLDFCAWYGVDPGRLITIPVPGSIGTSNTHTRTVFQALQQQIDLFGRPGKSFYTDVASYAPAGSPDRHSLQFIGAPEGASTFKKLSEKDTVTFADVLRAYPSARPGIEILCELVGDIKPRHYSIASAQSVVGDRVDLCVVTVDWVTPSGSPRYGQCTKYLVGLKPGQKVTVSIKPSVMKLPPSPKQPLIMAGLGTGVAPFRAFLQHRAHLLSSGQSTVSELGPIYYYFGSRTKTAEYLYGEEIEAFLLDGVIAKAGLAFSRDGPKKVYIQHKMLDDATELAQMLKAREGVFYLCGPTWPVPDVYEALVGALGQEYGMEPEVAGEYLEGLKEEERYVLEVY